METPDLLVALTTTLIAAAIGGAVAVRLRQSAVVGYILAGIAIGPRTPGLVADIEIVNALADLGVIFLMFSIGIQISFHEIRRVGPLVAVGGTAQVAASVAIGWAIGTALGWSSLEALFLGAFTSISSTAIAGRILGERGETESEHGVITVGWLAVQDLLTIVLIVLLSALSGEGGLEDIAFAVGKAVLFIALVIPIGSRVVPRLFEVIAASRRRELFTLGVVAVTLGTAALGSFFGISLALGAFLAGTLIADSDLSHQVMGEAMPFRDVFAGLFFVSIGMLVDPAVVVVSLPLVAPAAVPHRADEGDPGDRARGVVPVPAPDVRVRRDPACPVGRVLIPARSHRHAGRATGPQRGALRAPADERSPHRSSSPPPRTSTDAGASTGSRTG